MLARLHSVTIIGIEGVVCEVEVDVARGGFEKSIIVELPDAAVKESTERVKSEIINSGYKYPKTQSIVNLAPACLSLSEYSWARAFSPAVYSKISSSSANLRSTAESCP